MVDGPIDALASPGTKHFPRFDERVSMKNLLITFSTLTFMGACSLDDPDHSIDNSCASAICDSLDDSSDVAPPTNAAEPATALASTKGIDVLSGLLAQRHYEPNQADIERVSDSPASNLQDLATYEAGKSIVQLRAIAALSLYPTDSSIKTLLVLLESNSRPAVKRNALSTLSKMDEALISRHREPLANAVTQASSDPDLQVRLAAVDAMLVMPEGAKMIQAALVTEADSTVRTRLQVGLEVVR